MSRGWYGESKRHALARKGIKTKIKEWRESPIHIPVQLERKDPVQNIQNVQRERVQKERKQNEEIREKLEEMREERRLANSPERRQNPRHAPSEIKGLEALNKHLLARLEKIERLQKMGLTQVGDVDVGGVSQVQMTFTDDKTGIRPFDDAISNPTNPRREYDAELVEMPINDFIARQYYITSLREGKENVSYKMWSKASEDRMIDIYDAVKLGVEQPPFFLEYDSNNKVVAYQDDISKLYVAKLLKQPTVKVWIMRRRSEQEKLKDVYGEESEQYKQKVHDIERPFKPKAWEKA